MALKTIIVSLSTSGTLVVDPGECNVDAEHGVTSRLVWVLDDRGTDARFVLPNDGKGEGFKWQGAVNSNIFGDAHLIGRGKVIIANDRHHNADTIRTQPYTLLALDPKTGQVYTTGRPKDPVIINR